MKYYEINNFNISFSCIAIIKYEEIVVTRTKIEIHFVIGRMGSHVYQIYL